MALHLGDIAPDFAAETPDGPLSFPDGAGDRRIFVSNPPDFTPVCATEMGRRTLRPYLRTATAA